MINDCLWKKNIHLSLACLLIMFLGPGEFKEVNNDVSFFITIHQLCLLLPFELESAPSHHLSLNNEYWLVWNYFTPLCCLSISPLINSIWLPGCTKSSCKQITLGFHPLPSPKIQFLICIMRAKGGQCLLVIRIHLFTGSYPVADA